MQETGHVIQPGLHVAINHHAALAGQITGEDDVGLALGNRGRKLQRKRADRKSACAFIGRILVLIAGRIIELLARGMNKHRILRLLAKINFRPRELKARAT